MEASIRRGGAVPKGKVSFKQFKLFHRFQIFPVALSASSGVINIFYLHYATHTMPTFTNPFNNLEKQFEHCSRHGVTQGRTRQGYNRTWGGWKFNKGCLFVCIDLMAEKFYHVKNGKAQDLYFVFVVNILIPPLFDVNKWKSKKCKGNSSFLSFSS